MATLEINSDGSDISIKLDDIGVCYFITPKNNIKDIVKAINTIIERHKKPITKIEFKWTC